MAIVWELHTYFSEDGSRYCVDMVDEDSDKCIEVAEIIPTDEGFRVKLYIPKEPIKKAWDARPDEYDGIAQSDVITWYPSDVYIGKDVKTLEEARTWIDEFIDEFMFEF